MKVFTQISRVWGLILMVVLIGVNCLGDTAYRPVIPLEDSPSWRSYGNNAEYFTSADFNNDGAMDLMVVQNLSSFRIYYNQGNGLHTYPGWQIPATSAHYVTGIETCDLAGDGFPDILLFGGGYNTEMISCFLIKNINGIPETESCWNSGAHCVYYGAVGDIDGDTIPDVVMPSVTGPCVAYRGSLDGKFESEPFWSSAPDETGADCNLTDMDKDGDLDLVVSQISSPCLKVFYNQDGILETTASWQTEHEMYGLSVETVDLDLDGYPEIVVAGWKSPSVVFKNINGTPESEPQWFHSPSEDLIDKTYYTYVSAGDLTGDGFPELAFAGSWLEQYGYGGDHAFVYYNDSGTLSESPAWVSNNSRNFQGIRFEDFNGDSTLDLFACLDEDFEIHFNETGKCRETGLSLWMPETNFCAGDPCCLTATLCNPDDTLQNTPVFILLEAFGNFFSAPTWQPLNAGIGYYTLDIYPGISELTVLPEFLWPSIPGSASDLRIYGAMTDPQCTRLMGKLDIWYFGYR